MSDFNQLYAVPLSLPGTRRQRRPRCRAPRGLSNEQLKTWRRQRASGRELQRIHELRVAFDMLRTVIPRQPDDDKYSKVQVLKYAISYIKLLQEISLQDNRASTWSDAGHTPAYSTSSSSGPDSPYSLDWSCGSDERASRAPGDIVSQSQWWTRAGGSCASTQEMCESIFSCGGVADFDSLFAPLPTSPARYPAAAQTNWPAPHQPAHSQFRSCPFL